MPPLAINTTIPHDPPCGFREQRTGMDIAPVMPFQLLTRIH